MLNEYKTKENKLHEIMKKLTRENLAVAFSGGVDSSLLLKLAVIHAEEQGKKVYAVTANTELHPHGDLKIAVEQAKEIGAVHVILELNELKEADILNNPVDRCYKCKKYLFSSMVSMLPSWNAKNLVEGTNLDDTKVYRPGIKALDELGIISPLWKAEFTKSDVRRMALDYGITVAERPSTPCMATRFPYGTKLSGNKIMMAEKGEDFLKTLGLRNIRLRIHGDIARIETDICSLDKLLYAREKITDYLKNLGYSYITLDLEGFRSGSMDISISGK